MENIRTFAAGYYRRLSDALAGLDSGPLEPIAELLSRLAEEGGTLWVAGNGGSAAIADHAICDMTKGTFVPGRPALRAVSLVADSPLVTALANDEAYDQIFSAQLGYYLKPSDAVLLISSSGNSPNVVRACEHAKARGVPTIAFVGFDGGRLGELADHKIHVAVDDYGIVEDIHQSLVHVVTQYLRARAEES